MYPIIGLTGLQIVYYVVLGTLLALSAQHIRQRMTQIKTLKEAVVQGFAGLGLFVGMILGLSASPIVNAFIAAAFTLAGALVPIFDKNPATGISKTRRVLWMAPFGFSAALGVCAGLAIKANDLLSAPRTPTRDALMAEGFSETQVNSILTRWAEKATPAQILAPVEHKSRNPLLSSESPRDREIPLSSLVSQPIDLRAALANPEKTLTSDQRLFLLSLDPAMKTLIDDYRHTHLSATADDALAWLKVKLEGTNR